MKQIALLTLLTTFIGCGDLAQNPDKQAVVKQEPKPFIGHWMDAAQNSLTLNADGTGSQNLHWTLDDQDRLVFEVNQTFVDRCVYRVETHGGVTPELTVTLTLGCEIAGELIYLKVFE